MATKIFGPRKRRSRQHVIADQSVHHVEGFILDEGHTAQRFTYDYGYDLLMRTYDEEGYIEPHVVYFQIKASEKLKRIDGHCVFDIDIRDFNLWMAEQKLVVLVLYDAFLRHAFWLAVKQFFLEDPTRLPRMGAKWVRVRVPIVQRLNRQAIAALRIRKNKMPADS